MKNIIPILYTGKSWPGRDVAKTFFPSLPSEL